MLGVQTVAVDRRPARRRGRPRLRVHAGRRPTPTCCGPAPAKGIRAAFLTSAGYGEAGEEGRRAQDELVALADELGILLAGPERPGRGVDAGARCAPRSWRPYPPAGPIGVASQSGNFVSSFMNYAVQTGVGISRAVSAGQRRRGRRRRLPRLLRRRPRHRGRPGLRRGHRRRPRLLDAAGRGRRPRKPLVLVKGGATEGGQRAAASHTGSLATDDRVFDGVCRQAGVTRAATIEEAFEAAATFATQPLPAGPNVVVLTTAGGWGVVTADAITRDRHLAPAAAARRPAGRHRRAAAAPLEPQQPGRPAGGETRDTIPEVHASSSPATPTSTRSSTSASASSRTRPG